MSEDRTRTRRSSRRPWAFRPALGADVGLESRFLLSRAGATIHVAARHMVPHAQHFPPVQLQVANGGRSLLITDADGAQFEATVTSALQGTGPQISAGTVRGRPLPGGRVALTVDGTTQDSTLAINPVLKSPVKGLAHKFASGMRGVDHLLNIGSITVSSGEIGQIVGYRTANLSGPIVSAGTTPINRIAFANLLPGAAIGVGGDLNTLDILNNATLSGGPGIQVGRDLNAFSVGQNLTLLNGSSILVGRDVGLVQQGAKGTGPAGQGGIIIGNLVIGPGSSFVITRALDANVNVLGSGSGISNLLIPEGSTGTFTFRGGFTP